jgi:hypothetical protein
VAAEVVEEEEGERHEKVLEANQMKKNLLLFLVALEFEFLIFSKQFLMKK